VDIAICGIKTIAPAVETKYPMKNFQYTPKELLESIQIHYNTICLSGPWCKIYKASIIKYSNVRFDENISMGEDMLFVLSYLENCDTIMTTRDIYYNYILSRDGSLMLSFNREYFHSREFVYSSILKTMQKFKCSEVSINRMAHAYVTVLFNTLAESFLKFNYVDDEHRKEIIGQFISNEMVQKTLKEQANSSYLFRMLHLFVKYRFKCLLHWMLYVKFYLMRRVCNVFHTRDVLIIA